MIVKRKLLLLSMSCTLAALAIASLLLNLRAFQLELESALLLALGLACGLPAVIAVARKRLDIFEPPYAFAFATAIYMVLIPIVLIRKNQFYLGGIDYRSSLLVTLGLALLALLGFYLGYYWAANSLHAKRLHWPEINQENQRWAARVSVMLFGGFLSLVLLWIVTARVPIRSLWVLGSGATYGDAFALAAGPSIGYLYGAREALPTCLLLLLALRSKSRLSVISILILILVTLPLTVGDGARFRALILSMGFFAYVYLERGNQPSKVTLALFMVGVFVFIVGGIGFYRSPTVDAGSLRDRAIGQDTLGYTDVWETFVDGSSISVAAAAIVHLVPNYIDHLYGLSFLDFFIQPIPRFLWPEKPQSLGLSDLSSIWPRGTAAPFWTLFYINFSFIGVFVGMALWGWLSRWIYQIHLKNPNNRLAQVQLAVYLPFIIHAYGRGEASFAFNAYAFIYVMLPVWILALLLRRYNRIAHNPRRPINMRLQARQKL